MVFFRWYNPTTPNCLGSTPNYHDLGPGALDLRAFLLLPKPESYSHHVGPFAFLRLLLQVAERKAYLKVRVCNGGVWEQAWGLGFRVQVGRKPDLHPGSILLSLHILLL